MRIHERIDNKCTWIDTKHVEYNGKRYKVLGYSAIYELAET